MFKRIMVAARGEIAVRVIRACREMNIETVAAYSAADADSLAVKLATHAVCIGPAPAQKSYLNQDAILTAALWHKCDALHPGYGFLSENAEFADRCNQNGICFIGPSGDAIRNMGNKATAREVVKKSGMPVVPGSDGFVKDAKTAAKVAQDIGYPVLIKASAGGGGRGMRRADSSDDIASAFEAAKAEAIACFGNGELYIEKLILNPRHIEVQILADSHGNAVHLGERDCSLQRKNQKLIEEAPAKGISEQQRNEMGEHAKAVALAVGYVGAGTIEFVMDKEYNYYFIEMNTRVQVEHPVTEMVTGVDIVHTQIRVAAGLTLGFAQSDVSVNGYAMECRINAENPANDFSPCPGNTKFLHLPGGAGVRVDSALFTGYTVSPFYDSLVAKIIVHAPTRLAALRKMRRALEEFVLEGYPTTAEFQHLILHHSDFIRGGYDTGFLQKNMPTLLSWQEETEGSNA